MANKLNIAAPPIQRGQGFTVSQPTAEALPLARIRTDGGTQARFDLNTDTVAEYRQAMQDGAVFPPVVVYYDGTDHWLADGFHRVAATEQIRMEIAADVRPGTKRDAILHAVGANKTHGLRRTHKDVQRSIWTLLNDAEWQKWSDREIARQVGCHHETVGAQRGKLAASGGIRQIEPRLVERNGTTYEQAPRKGPVQGFVNAQAHAERLGGALSFSDGTYTLDLNGVRVESTDFADMQRQLVAAQQAGQQAAQPQPAPDITPDQAQAQIAKLLGKAEQWAVGTWGRKDLCNKATDLVRLLSGNEYDMAIQRIASVEHERELPPDAGQFTTPEGWRWTQTGPLLYQLTSSDGWTTNAYSTRQAVIEEAAQISGEPKRTAVTTVIPAPAAPLVYGHPWIDYELTATATDFRRVAASARQWKIDLAQMQDADEETRYEFSQAVREAMRDVISLWTALPKD